MRVRGPATYTLAMQHGRCNPEPPFSAHPVVRMLSSELVRSVLDSAPDAMIVIDSGGTILFANTQVTALFGFAMFNATAQEQRRCAEDMNRWLAEGKLKPPVGKVFPLAEAAAAHRFLEENTLHGAGTLVGKVLLVP